MTPSVEYKDIDEFIEIHLLFKCFEVEDYEEQYMYVDAERAKQQDWPSHSESQRDIPKKENKSLERQEKCKKAIVL